MAALKRQMRELVDDAAGLAERIEALSGEIEQLETWLPFRYAPPECRVDVGILKMKRRPRQPISKPQYWSIVSRQIEDMLDSDPDGDHWAVVIANTDPLLNHDRLSDQLRHSDYLIDAIGPVPEQIFPEQFEYDPDRADLGEGQSLEEFVFSVWPHA